jgi:hypothetical protein
MITGAIWQLKCRLGGVELDPGFAVVKRGHETDLHLGSEFAMFGTILGTLLGLAASTDHYSRFRLNFTI